MANGTLKVSNIETSSGSGTITVGASGETVDLSNGTITGITQGITMCDEFRLTSDKTVSNTQSDITANLARTTRAGFSLLGSSGMTESSGIFTFPSTGYYMVGILNSYTTTDANRANAVRLYVTTNNSTYYNVGASSVNASDDGGSSNSFGGIYSEYLIDVTDTSNVKVKFDALSNNNSTTYNGSTSSTSDGSSTRFMFRRIGDT